MGLTLAEADSLPLAKYSGLFFELNWRADRKPGAVDAPSPDFVLQQMELMRAQGVKVN